MNKQEFLKTIVFDIVSNCVSNGDHCVGCCFHLKSGDCLFMRTGPEHWLDNLEKKNGDY